MALNISAFCAWCSQSIMESASFCRRYDSMGKPLGRYLRLGGLCAFNLSDVGASRGRSRNYNFPLSLINYNFQ
jgi:hypothetical protein